MSLYIIHGYSGKGRSYNSFFVQNNLIGLDHDDLKLRLTEISDDANYSDTDRERATVILKNIIDTEVKQNFETLITAGKQVRETGEDVIISVNSRNLTVGYPEGLKVPSLKTLFGKRNNK